MEQAFPPPSYSPMRELSLLSDSLPWSVYTYPISSFIINMNSTLTIYFSSKLVSSDIIKLFSLCLVANVTTLSNDLASFVSMQYLQVIGDYAVQA